MSKQKKNTCINGVSILVLTRPMVGWINSMMAASWHVANTSLTASYVPGIEAAFNGQRIRKDLKSVLGNIIIKNLIT